MSVPARDTDSDVLLMEVAETDVPDLLAEVERLRAGIEAISSVSWDVVHPSWVKHMCRDLLNPPTEGETDGDA